MNTSLQPAWLREAQEHYTDNAAREQLSAAYAIAAATPTPPDERSRTLVKLLLNLRSDATLLAAGLLVEPWRKKQLDLEALAASPCHGVIGLLQALDDLALIDQLHEQEQSDIERLRKMLLAMASDMRAVILKLTLQVVLMRNLSAYSAQEQQRSALQTRDLLAPLANRLGIAQLKSELEDRALRVLEPDIYQEIAGELEGKRVDRERYINRIIDLLRYKLTDAGIHVKRLYGRVKHINSIYLKMKRKGLRFEQLNDIRAVRVEVETEADCYRVLSVVNDLWQPIAAEFDDYIAHPKANGYQSLHTSLIGPENRVIEVQIRTSKMHEHAELGVAAHWLYKEKGIRHSKQFEQQIEWLRRMIEGGDHSRGDIVFDQFKNEAFRDRVYVVSPQGRVVDLPEGATPLDFAYHIHTQLGHRCRGAKINGQIMPLTTALKNGDSVEILTQKEANPSRDWLNDHLGYLQSGRAKAKVRSYFKKLEKEKSVQAGQEMLERESRRLGITPDNKMLEDIARQSNVHSITDLYAGIGFGDIGVLNIIHELSARQQKSAEQPTLDERLARIPVKAPRKQSRQNIDIDGVDNLLVNYATCCQPVPPVAIRGFISQGRGVNIHRADCPNLQHLAKAHPERILDVHWNAGASGLFTVVIAIEAFDRPHLLRDISQILANEKIAILDVKMQQDNRNRIYGTFTLEITDMEQLSRVIDRIAQVKDVASVRRKQK
ncbi:RelA/SpoT family protein [Cardiobacterium valvarum]|uniref:GTP pyrophosphokinase n=1 Tax=Cardiobacterium valvarum F0432 TaxID=797473 RepID=G9ZDY3_9GAMM|nr:bifunctional (p)ppGpp synthetase/guanosine-3',5'-bis(diphosphate) 3'-pyrophosphohydrolase [Cardiobacterium valvarum]EHM55070.1 putative GTP diphosphokinase [Cardiobacterium valvarum F0432]